MVLHLLRREPEPRVKFAAVALLRQAPVERSSTRRLRQIVLLMLRVSALILLALAFARPFFASPAAAVARNATIVLLDTSYSMSSPGRFARAQQLARDAVNRAPARDDVGVVTFADRAELVAPPSSGRAAALAAIDSAAAGAGGTRYLAAVNAAGRALGGRRGTVVVVTDLQAGGWDAGDHATVPESARVEVRDVGALPDNLAVVGLRSDGDRVVATVRNDSQRAREATVRLTVDGRVAGGRSASIAPHGAGDVVFSGVTGGEAAAAVDDRDGLQADNVRYARLTGASRGAVLVVTATGDLDRDAFYVHQALVAGGTDRGVPGVTGVAASQLGSWTSARMAGFGSVLLLSTRGLERRGRELIASHVAAGGGLLIAAGPGCRRRRGGRRARRQREAARAGSGRSTGAATAVAGAGRYPAPDLPAVRTGGCLAWPRPVRARGGDQRRGLPDAGEIHVRRSRPHRLRHRRGPCRRACRPI